MRPNSPMNRRGSVPAPLTMQEKTVSAIRGILSAAGLEGAEQWAYSNVGDMTVTRPNSFAPLFTIHMDFQDGRFGGGVLRAGERVVNGAPYGKVGGKDEMIRERSFYARYAEPGAMERAMEIVRVEAARFAPGHGKPLERPAAADLVARIDAVVDTEGAVVALHRLVSYLAERAVEAGDDVMLREAAEYVGDAPAPAPGR